MNFTLYTADCAGNATNCLYPHESGITCPEELAAAVSRDHVFARYRDGYRLAGNFLRSDVIPMDCDNDHSENPNDWLTAEKLEDIFADTDMAIYPSRHHMLPKGNRAARPKYHVLFPVSECADAGEYAALKAAIQERYGFFDGNALDAARFFFGSACEPADITWHEGCATIDETLADGRGGDTPDCGTCDEAFDDGAIDYDTIGPSPAADDTIYEGSRNSTLSRFAGKVLIRYGRGDKARRVFLEKAAKCSPPLPEKELCAIWASAVRFAEKAWGRDGYAPPEEYDAAPGGMRPDDYSDVGEAMVFAREYGDELRFTKATDYLRHDGLCWREEPQLAVGAAEEFLDRQLKDAADAVTRAEKALADIGVDAELVRKRGSDLMNGAPTDKLSPAFALLSADTYRKFVIRCRNYKNIVGFLNAAKPLLAADIREFDRDPYLLNTPAGTFDLSAGMSGLREHRPGDYITKVTKVSPGDEGTETWLEALDTFFGGDRELIDYVQAQVGMAAVGRVYQEHMIIAYGSGANGKSTFWNAVFRVLGSYAGKISAEALTVNCRRNVKPEMAELKGKRLIIASENEEGTRLNTSTVKQLCSTDEIQAEKKYRDPFHFTPSHTLVLYTNHLPKVGANDEGIWRRLIVIPFNARIEGKSDIKNYADYLCENAGGAIMKWIIEGAEKAIRAGFHTSTPRAVEDAIGRYRDANDWLGQFIEEYCETGPLFSEKSGELYQVYRAACMRNGEYIRSTADFYGALEKVGFVRRRTDRGRRICGLCLKEEQDLLA